MIDRSIAIRNVYVMLAYAFRALRSTGTARITAEEFDHLHDLLAEILADFDRLEGERYLIITGDHGQRLGEGGHWGHNDLVPEVSDVPVIVVARVRAAPALI